MNWAASLRLAAAMGVPPDAFWRLSLVEWLALLRAPAPAPLGRRALHELMTRYPDEPNGS